MTDISAFKRHWKSRSVQRMTVCCCGILMLLFSASAQAQQSGTHTSGQLIEKLQQGGYVLYVRHAATDHTQVDSDLSDFNNCGTQRNLSEQGKRETRVMKKAIAALGIKIGDVFTSPYCRCVDTAKIAFGRFDILRDMRATFYTDEVETKILTGFLHAQLSKIPRNGANTVLIGHTANLRDVTRVWPKPEGGVHIFKPLGDNGYEHLGRITPDAWAPLAGIR